VARSTLSSAVINADGKGNITYCSVNPGLVERGVPAERGTAATAQLALS